VFFFVFFTRIFFSNSKLTLPLEIVWYAHSQYRLRTRNYNLKLFTIKTIIMKKLFTLLFCAVAFIANATDYTWNFSTWTGTTGYPAIYTASSDLMLINPGASTNFGAINSNSKTIGGTSYTQRFQMNGAGYSSTAGFSAIPTQRFLAINVAGSSTIQVAFITGSSSYTRTCYVTDGVNTISSAADSNTGTLLTANYTGGPAKIYIFGDAAINLYMVSATNVTSASAVYPTSSANQSQTVSAGSAITNITFATPMSDIAVAGLPTGLSAAYSGGVLTVSGTVDGSATSGAYTYTYTSTLYSVSTAVTLGTITVSSSATPVSEVNSDLGKITHTDFYSVTGNSLGSNSNSLPNGIYIEKDTYENGAVISKKIAIRK
jgi:hypothetical protein